LDNFDFTAQPPASKDRIYISWSEQWDIKRYAADYLAQRGLRTDGAAQERILKVIEECPLEGSLRKADIDYYLDCRVKNELEVTQPVRLQKTK
jgi:hypothetical protein